MGREEDVPDGRWIHSALYEIVPVGVDVELFTPLPEVSVVPGRLVNVVL